MPTPPYHIAHVLPWPAVGGTEHATLRIAQALEGEQFRSVAFCPGAASPVRALFGAGGFETAVYDAVEPSYRHPSEFLRSTFRLAREFRRRRIALVHCADLLGAYYAAVAGRLAGARVLCHIRCSHPEVARRHRRFLRAVDRFAFVSRDAWRNFGYPVPERRGRVVYDGVASRAGGGAAEARGVRQELGIPEGVKVVGMVARVAPAKDFETLARAAARVIAARPAVRFLIVGDHSRVENYREHYARVRRALDAEGVGDYFIFTGHREDVARLVGAMDVFVLSTHTEGLPLVILEAMAQGRPVVATEVGGVPEAVADGENGLLHPPGDDARQAAHLLSLLGDEALAARLGAAGRRRVETEFTPERFAAEMSCLYRDVLGVGGRRAASARHPGALEQVGRN